MNECLERAGDDGRPVTRFDEASPSSKWWIKC